jgi:hypothetical protein
MYTVRKEIVYFKFSARLPPSDDSHLTSTPLKLSLTGRGILDTSGRKIAAEFEIDEWPHVNVVARLQWLCELP